LLRRDVAGSLGTNVDAVQIAAVCPRCGGDHGAPTARVVGGALHLSLTRRSGLVVTAMSPDLAVGVDAERQGAVTDEVRDLLCHPAADPNANLTRTWVRKEAVLKATGHGLTVEPRQFAVRPHAESPGLLAWEAPGDPTLPIWVRDLDLPAPYVGSVAIVCADRPDVIVRQADSEALSRTATH
jgi:4'-phosphopantetheinyl transferase